jgi:hypothetical protein
LPGDLAIAPAAAADSTADVLTFSVSSEAYPARPHLAGSFAPAGSDADAAWTISCGNIPGTVRHGPGTQPPVLSGTGSDLLLSLYGRLELDPRPVAALAHAVLHGLNRPASARYSEMTSKRSGLRRH